MAVPQKSLRLLFSYRTTYNKYIVTKDPIIQAKKAIKETNYAQKWKNLINMLAVRARKTSKKMSCKEHICSKLI